MRTASLRGRPAAAPASVTPAPPLAPSATRPASMHAPHPQSRPTRLSVAPDTLPQPLSAAQPAAPAPAATTSHSTATQPRTGSLRPSNGDSGAGQPQPALSAAGLGPTMASGPTASAGGHTGAAPQLLQLELLEVTHELSTWSEQTIHVIMCLFLFIL